MSLTLADIRFAYSDDGEILRGVSLEVGQGERVALVGRNGAGKTTLARIMAGLLAPSSGRATVHGEPLHSLPPSRRASLAGYQFQDPDTQLFRPTVADDVAFGPANQGLSPEQVEERVSSVLALTGLTDYAGTHPHDLSLSGRKMAALAGTLALASDFLILDEPGASLDWPARQRLEHILGHLAASGTGVVVISHDMDFVCRLFPRVLALDNGELAADVSPQDLLADGGILARCGLLPPPLAELGQRLGLPRPATDIDTLLDQLAAMRS